MDKETYKIYSNILQRNLEINFYGHYGFAIMMFPALSDSPFIYEENGTIDAISGILNNGKCRVFTINTLNNEIWYSDKYSPEEKADLFNNYNNCVIDEIVPLIYSKCNGPVPIVTCGASIGGFVASNLYFRRPDNFFGNISLSGFYNLQYLSKDYFDENCYFNSPEHYLPNLNDSFWLSYLLSKHHIYLFSGSGENEFPDNTKNFSKILNSKNISNNTEIWGKEYAHNFDTWNKMLHQILSTKL